MIVSQLKLYNFRKFKARGQEPGLCISFHNGLNVIVGENDSGKSAVIDAIKLVLQTQSNDNIRVEDRDFYTENDVMAHEFRIELILSDFCDNEAKNFVEYLKIIKNDNITQYYLHLYYRAWKENDRIFTELRYGNIDGNLLDSRLDGRAKELLKCVYLRPLRDASRELSAGRNSRISQILYNHPAIKSDQEHKLIEIMKEANIEIEQYFTQGGGSVILSTIRKALAAFNEKNISSDATIKASDIQLKPILESLSLTAGEVQPGLGEQNLLFIAAELLLLQQDANGGIRLALIEELEAHLHPQAQLRLIQYLQNEYNSTGAQIIITTHSITLSSKINLKNLILLKNGNGYDFSPEKTELQKGDYLFLQRFLDAMKANLFFAKGVIMVEGDAENIVIPIIAEIIDLPLERYGVSIVSVGSKAFLRYSRIFIRSDGQSMIIPISVVTDCDVKPEYSNDVFVNNVDIMSAEVKNKESYYSKGCVKGFISPQWTFEYCLALSSLRELFHRSIHYGKKVKNSDKYILTLDKIVKVEDDIKSEREGWSNCSNEEYAFKIYNSMLEHSGNSALKSIVAQCFAALLRWSISVVPEGLTQESMFDLDLYQLRIDNEKKSEIKSKIEGDKYLRYIVDAIKYAAQQLP